MDATEKSVCTTQSESLSVARRTLHELGPVAHLVERLLCKQRVRSSTLLRSNFLLEIKRIIGPVIANHSWNETGGNGRSRHKSILKFDMFL